jgi:hypothetical protein
VIWEVGLTVVFVAANNCRITSDKWAGTLSSSSAQYLLSQFSGSLRRMFSVYRLRTCQYNFPSTVCASGHNTLIVK